MAYRQQHRPIRLIAAVQTFDAYATELYLQYRLYQLKRSGLIQDIEDMHVGTTGVRVKF